MILVIWPTQMPRRFFRLVSKADRLLIAAQILILYTAGAFLMPLFEGPESVFASLLDYSWWFIVTATTVGYGDISPTTAGGKTVAMIIMLLGIGVIAVAGVKLADSIFDIGRNRMKGLNQLNEENHLVIFGYTQGLTEELVREIRNDQTAKKMSIVLCSSRTEENPLPKTVHFVKAELSSDDVLQRACVNRASGIIVHGHDDNESLVIALAVRSANSKAHIVVQLDKEESELHIKRIDPYIECVTPLSIPLIVQAVQDRGATLVIKALLSNITDDTIFRLDIPFNNQNWDFKTLQRFFKDQLESTLIAVTTSSSPQAPIKVNPASNFLVASGTSVFYIGPRRLTPKAIKWENIQAKANID